MHVMAPQQTPLNRGKRPVCERLFTQGTPSAGEGIAAVPKIYVNRPIVGNRHQWDREVVRRMRRVLSAALGAVAIATVGLLPSASPRAHAQEARPNILVIMTDDQRANGTLQVMPETRAYFSSGLTFTSAMATTPLCCPSRASIFTGRYAHNHLVRSNNQASAAALDQTTTTQYYLKQAGYRTGIFGKFLNGWDLNTPPPFFDEYAIMKGGYDGTTFGTNVGGPHRTTNVADYSTDYVKYRALDFLEGTEAEDDQPWLLYVTPFAPHNPSAPAGRHQYAAIPSFKPNPAMLEKDFSDKPPRFAKRSQPYDERRIVRRRAMQLRSLMAVDELVASMTDALATSNETNTLVFFMSDNGYQWGEHGLMRKGLPYLPSLRIPLMFRWDGRVSPGRDHRLAANIDIAPTILDATQVQPAHTVDGRSLLDSWSRDELLTEIFPYDGRPELMWASLISRDYQYIEHYSTDETVPAFREYYDLEADPWQLRNTFAEAGGLKKAEVSTLSSRLSAARSCPLLSPCP